MTIPNTGRISGVEGQSGLLAKNFNDALKIWSQGGGLLPNAYSGCEGTCYLKVPGAGFEVNCTEPKQAAIDAGKQTFYAYSHLKAITAGLNVTDFDDLDCSIFDDEPFGSILRTQCEALVAIRVAPLFHVGFEPVFSGPNLTEWSFVSRYTTLEYLVTDTLSNRSR